MKPFGRVVCFKDKNGVEHKYYAQFVDGFMVASDWEAIQKIINCEN